VTASAGTCRCGKARVTPREFAALLKAWFHSAPELHTCPQLNAGEVPCSHCPSNPAVLPNGAAPSRCDQQAPNGWHASWDKRPHIERSCGAANPFASASGDKSWDTGGKGDRQQQCSGDGCGHGGSGSDGSGSSSGGVGGGSSDSWTPSSGTSWSSDVAGRLFDGSGIFGWLGMRCAALCGVFRCREPLQCCNLPACGRKDSFPCEVGFGSCCSPAFCGPPVGLHKPYLTAATGRLGRATLGCAALPTRRAHWRSRQTKDASRASAAPVSAPSLSTARSQTSLCHLVPLTRCAYAM
jgi:hypothetical protein